MNTTIRFLRASASMDKLVRLLPIVALLLSGCSMRPGAGDVRHEIESRISQDADGRIRLIDLTKTNGAEGELLGSKTYTVAFTTELVFTADCRWVNGFQGSMVTFRTVPPNTSSRGGLSGFMNAAGNAGTEVRSGQHVKLTGQLTYQKTDKGWTPAGLSFSNTEFGPVPALSTTPPPSSNSQPKGGSAADQEKAIRNNLREIAVAVDMTCLETGKTSVRFDELIGPDKYIKKVPNSIAGEDYRTLGLIQDRAPLVVRTADGRIVAFSL